MLKTVNTTNFSRFQFPGRRQTIFIMDITSLYTVIPNCEGLLTLKHFFDLRTVKEPSSEILLRLAELVLRLNCFSFAGSYYKKINGVAMDTKMGPSYANLFVGYIDRNRIKLFKVRNLKHLCPQHGNSLGVRRALPLVR